MRKYARIVLICAIGLAAAIVYLSRSSNPARPKQNGLKQDPRKAPPITQSNDVSESELEKLASLPYTDWSGGPTDVTKSGVIWYERNKSYPGLNLFNSRNLSQGHLMDTQGKILHSWSVPKQGNNSWHTIQIAKDGALFAVVKDQKLMKLSWDSSVEWEYSGMVHHDVAIAPSGHIYVPTRRPEMWKTKHFSVPVVKESITVLTGRGAFVKEINLFDALRPFISGERIQKIRTWMLKEDIPARLAKKDPAAATWWENKRADVLHVNSIQLIVRELPGVARAGDILLSVRQLDLICIFRPDTGKLVWTWGPGEVECQHHATLLENDNILLFDNGCKRRYSRVVEVNPRSKQIEWEYKASKPEDFFSHRRGAAQRLPNGNTLISESDRGRVFEVSPDGKIVWEFLNPDVFTEKQRRAIIYRMIRIPEDFLSRQLGLNKSHEPSRRVS